METDSRQRGSAYRRISTLLVVVTLALVPLTGLGAAQTAGEAGNQSYVAVQNGECVPITSFTGEESAREFYDYRLPEEFADNPYVNATGEAFGSEGTTELQEPNTSIVFLYTDTQGTNETSDDDTSLVLVHGAEADDSSDGGTATFTITNLPEDGEWEVRDDDYEGATNEDNWNVSETETVVDWLWGEAATDGGAFTGLDNDTNVTIDPAFNEASALANTTNGTNTTSGTVQQWQVLSNETDDVNRTDLELNQSLQLAAGTCGDVAGDAADDNDTATNETATVSFENQTSDGTSVIVQNATVPRGGYVTIHNESLLDGDAVGSVVGVSDYLEAGEYDNLTVDLFDVPGAEFNESELTENQTLIAMPHEETTGDETYDFVSSNGTDDVPYTDNGEAVIDDANVTIGNETTVADDNESGLDTDFDNVLVPAGGNDATQTANNDTTDNDTATNETATVSFDDQTSDGTSVIVQNATVPRGGYVTIHNESLLDGDAVGSVVGVSDYLEAGEYDNLTVDLFDVPGAEFNESELTENQTLIAMPHEETTGDETYDFVSSNGTDDVPYTDNGEAVTDDAEITIGNETDETDGNETDETDGNVTDDTDTETPDEDTPDEETPDDDTPDEETPDEATPEDDTPDEATPN
ncbi:hypothetical protein NDI56_10985 [Haloarcula sp. S1CR25-12]|uniref:DUF7282 domain-containing protein n=1 Tax=Haloarcula saliterrae TaxID=2950534 RepID=A0ABU2FCC7_9EURY|nr:hypothetical protein [Haloarcula sp. S1CR25-12]MDS0259918.1 hypothetical protein [Haloarcula sp. S1CR25-12]